MKNKQVRNYADMAISSCKNDYEKRKAKSAVLAKAYGEIMKKAEWNPSNLVDVSIASVFKKYGLLDKTTWMNDIIFILFCRIRDYYKEGNLDKFDKAELRRMAEEESRKYNLEITQQYNALVHTKDNLIQDLKNEICDLKLRLEGHQK